MGAQKGEISFSGPLAGEKDPEGDGGNEEEVRIPEEQSYGTRG